MRMRCIFGVLMLAALPLQALADGPRVIGCEITIDIPRTVDCLRNAVDREVREAERAVRRTADSQLANLQDQLERSQRDAELKMKIEVAKAEAAGRAGLAASQAALGRAQDQIEALQGQIPAGVYAALLAEMKKQGALFNCLQASNIDIAVMLQQFSANPVAFAQARSNEAITATFVAIPATMQSELNNIARGVATTAGDRVLLIRHGTDAMVRVADNVPGARCLMQTMPPQLRAASEAAAGNALNLMEGQARGLVNQHIIPAVRAGVAIQLRDGFAQVVREIPTPIPTVNREIEKRVPFLQGLTLTEREMRAIARGVLYERRYQATFVSGADAVDALTAALANPGATAASVEPLRVRAENALRGTADYPQLYAALGVELMRAIGHKYIDSERVGHGGFLMNQGFAFLHLGGATGENVVDAVCGLIPEAGAAICAVVMQGVISAWDGGALPQIQNEASNLVHASFDSSIDRVRAELDRGGRLDEIRSRLGPADAVIAAIPAEALLSAWANGFLDNDIRVVDRFARSVSGLSSAAARR